MKLVKSQEPSRIDGVVSGNPQLAGLAELLDEFDDALSAAQLMAVNHLAGLWINSGHTEDRPKHIPMRLPYPDHPPEQRRDRVIVFSGLVDPLLLFDGADHLHRVRVESWSKR